jgi:hypothetical protein
VTGAAIVLYLWLTASQAAFALFIVALRTHMGTRRLLSEGGVAVLPDDSATR